MNLSILINLVSRFMGSNVDVTLRKTPTPPLPIVRWLSKGRKEGLVPRSNVKSRRERLSTPVHWSDCGYSSRLLSLKVLCANSPVRTETWRRGVGRSLEDWRKVTGLNPLRHVLMDYVYRPDDSQFRDYFTCLDGVGGLREWNLDNTYSLYL